MFMSIITCLQTAIDKPQTVSQEGYVDELSTWFYLDTALSKSSESLLFETKRLNIRMINTHFKS